MCLLVGSGSYFNLAYNLADTPIHNPSGWIYKGFPISRVEGVLGLKRGPDISPKHRASDNDFSWIGVGLSGDPDVCQRLYGDFQTLGFQV